MTDTTGTTSMSDVTGLPGLSHPGDLTDLTDLTGLTAFADPAAVATTAVGDRTGTRGEPLHAVDEFSFRKTMSRFATFVTVITVATPDGPAGCTATSVFSLSLRPPTLVVSLRSAGRTLEDVLDAGRFAVNVLSWRQRDLSGRFAAGDPRHRFDGLPYSVWGGAPVLDGTSASVVCRLRHTMPALDHTLLFGTVALTRTRREEPPLVLLDGRSHTLGGEGEGTW